MNIQRIHIEALNTAIKLLSNPVQYTNTVAALIELKNILIHEQLKKLEGKGND